MNLQHRRNFMRLVKLARKEFLAYILLFNNPQTTDTCISKLHRYLAEIVQGVDEGTLDPFQACSVPPQHGKSTVLCIEGASWIMGRNPGINVGLGGHRFDLMKEFSNAVKDRTQHPWYKLVFPTAGHPVVGRNQIDNWKLTGGSSFRAKTVGSKFTGSTVDWLILDDVHAGREEAESQTQRKKVHTWYFADCVSRLSPNAKVFIIGTRWHPDDLIGYLTRPEYISDLRENGHHDRVFHVTNLPAIAEEEDILGREEGEALFPEVRSAQWLSGVRISIPKYEWQSQFQGQPVSVSEGQADVSRFKRIKKSRVPVHLQRLRGWDLALTEKQTSDYSCGALCAYDKENDEFYIIDMFRTKLSWTKLKKRFVSLSLKDKREWNCNRLGLEAVGGFEIGLQEVREALSGEVKVEKRNPRKGGKLMRAQDWLNKLEDRKVYLVEGDWNKDFIDELMTFPDGAHDDQVDAISIAFESLVRKGKLLIA